MDHKSYLSSTLQIMLQSFPNWAFQFIQPPVANECSHHCTSLPTLGLVIFLKKWNYKMICTVVTVVFALDKSEPEYFPPNLMRGGAGWGLER